VQPHLHAAEGFSHGLALVGMEGYGYGYIDRNGEYTWGPMLSTGVLHGAVRGRDHQKIIKLLDSGEDANAMERRHGTIRNYAEWTPLHIAAQRSDFSTSKLLLEKGAEADLRNDEGITPIYLAARSSQTLVDLLISKGANVNATAINGMTPLHMGVSAGNTQVVKTLIESGADVEKANNQGLTALHIAARVGCTSVAEILLNNGAEVNVKDHNGNTPFSVALDNNQADMKNLLLEYGAEK
jgi:ankyrin repeat protein